MASYIHAPAQDTTVTHEMADRDKKTMAGTNHVERVETNDLDYALSKVEADAKLDEFGARSKTNPEEIALVKKLDRTILVSIPRLGNLTTKTDSNDNSPCYGLCTCKTNCTLPLHLASAHHVCYSFNFLDRNALVNAKLNSLEKDLGLKGTQYNTLISILFVGYIAGQIPSNMILNRVRPSWYLGGKSGPSWVLPELMMSRLLHGLVDRLRVDFSGQRFWKYVSMSFHAWCD